MVDQIHVFDFGFNPKSISFFLLSSFCIALTCYGYMHIYTLHTIEGKYYNASFHHDAIVGLPQIQLGADFMCQQALFELCQTFVTHLI